MNDFWIVVDSRYDLLTSWNAKPGALVNDRACITVGEKLFGSLYEESYIFQAQRVFLKHCWWSAAQSDKVGSTVRY